MAPALKQAQEERHVVSLEIKKLADRNNEEGRTWTAEDETEWKRVNADYDERSKKIEKLERADQVDRDQAAATDLRNVNPDGRVDRSNPDQASAPTNATRTLGISAWCRAQSGFAISTEEREALDAIGINENRRTLDLNLNGTENFRSNQADFSNRHHTQRTFAQHRALSAVSGSAGAVTVPEGFSNSLEVNMLSFSGMMQVADIIQTQSGQDIPWPTVDDTSNSGVQIGAATAVSEADPTFGSITFGAYKMSSRMVKVPTELMQDTAFNLVAELGRMLGERLGRIINTLATTGSGAATLAGLMNRTTLGVTTADANDFVADEIIDLEHSVDPAYRSDPGAGYMFHDNILLELRKLKDGSGRYLFQNNFQLGAPDTINGRRFTINQDMASATTTGLKVMAFGQLSKYKIRQVQQIRLRRLTERFADEDVEAFVAFSRVDGNLLDAGTAPVKHMIMA